jgi:hypothetical protein
MFSNSSTNAPSPNEEYESLMSHDDTDFFENILGGVEAADIMSDMSSSSDNESSDTSTVQSIDDIESPYINIEDDESPYITAGSIGLEDERLEDERLEDESPYITAGSIGLEDEGLEDERLEDEGLKDESPYITAGSIDLKDDLTDIKGIILKMINDF